MPLENSASSEGSHIFLATSSDRRLAALQAIIEEATHNRLKNGEIFMVSPDRNGASEPTWSNTLLVSILKPLSMVSPEFLRTKFGPSAKIELPPAPVYHPDLDINKMAVALGSDIVTVVAPLAEINLEKNVESQFLQLLNRPPKGDELLKVDRKLVGVTDPLRQIEILSQDQARMEEIYCRRPFLVTYAVSIAARVFSPDGQSHVDRVAGWRIMMLMKPIPVEVLRQSYQVGINPKAGGVELLGIAKQSGPRLDLAALAPEYGLQIVAKSMNDPEAKWGSIDYQIMIGLVRGGVIPVHLFEAFLFADLRLGEDAQENPFGMKVMEKKLRPIGAEVISIPIGQTMHSAREMLLGQKTA